jgi:hypothetical protein
MTRIIFNIIGVNTNYVFEHKRFNNLKSMKKFFKNGGIYDNDVFYTASEARDEFFVNKYHEYLENFSNLNHIESTSDYIKKFESLKFIEYSEFIKNIKTPEFKDGIYDPFYPEKCIVEFDPTKNTEGFGTMFFQDGDIRDKVIYKIITQNENTRINN